jgi:hypothetical protein
VHARSGQVLATDGGQGYDRQGHPRETLEKLMRCDYNGAIRDPVGDSVPRPFGMRGEIGAEAAHQFLVLGSGQSGHAGASPTRWRETDVRSGSWPP